MELSPLAGNRALKTQLSQQEEGAGGCPTPTFSPAPPARESTPWPGSCAEPCCAPPRWSGGPCGHCGPCKKVFSGIHPDVAVISGPAQGKPITVDQVRQLRADAYIRPNEGGAEGLSAGGGRPDERQRPERHAQAAGGGPGLRRLPAAGGERRRGAPDGALPVRGALSPPCPPGRRRSG